MPVPENLLKRRAELEAVIEQHQRGLAIAQREIDVRTAELAALDFAIKAIEEQEGSADVRARTPGRRRNLRQIVLDDIAAQPLASSVEELVERTGLRVKAVKSAIEHWLSNGKIEPIGNLYRLPQSDALSTTTERIE